jgi:transcriptional/translational regulatory protein YebC/TACO1
MFKKRGVIGIEKSAIDEDKLLELALDAGADDVNSDGDTFQVLASPEKFHAVRETLEKGSLAIAHSEVTRIPENTVAVSGHAAEQVLKLMEDLEDHDDVQGVAANFDISDEEMAHFSAA